MADALRSYAGVPVREPYESEQEFFRSSPHVAGMATQDDRIAINPFSGLDKDQQNAIVKNEASRVWMRRPEWQPEMPLTPDQSERFATYGAPTDQRSTVIARLLSGDASAGSASQEQLEFAQSLASAMQRSDWGEPTMSSFLRRQ